MNDFDITKHKPARFFLLKVAPDSYALCSAGKTVRRRIHNLNVRELKSIRYAIDALLERTEGGE